MSSSSADVVICGAGICGIALTSDKSSEAYRNWWPGPGSAMVQLMNRSIDWLERWARESRNRFLLNRRGYVYLTADPRCIDDFKRSAAESALLGAGEVRYHLAQPATRAYTPIDPHGFEDQPIGADLVLERALIRERFPYLNENVVALLHPRRCGWFSGQQLGLYLLEQARAHGARLIEGKVDRVEVKHDRIQSVHFGSDAIDTPCFVNAAGPYLKEVGQLVGVDLPVFNELHCKISIRDTLGIVPRDAPLLVWADPQYLPWSPEEQMELAASDETRWLLNQFPAGAHLRPEGGPGSNILLLLYNYHTDPCEPIWPPKLDPVYPEIALRGLATMIPGLRAYLGKTARPYFDGGYYTRTRENRALAGPLPVEGAYVCGAVSGHGLMAAGAVGELLAAHVTGNPLPDYAPAFSLERYADPAYQQLLENWGASGQL